MIHSQLFKSIKNVPVLWIAFPIGTLYWLLTVTIDSISMDENSWLEHLILPPAYVLSHRLIVLVIIVILAFYAQSQLNKSKSQEKRDILLFYEQDLLFHTIFQNISVGIVLLSLDKKIIDRNLAFQNMVGYSENDLKNRDLANILFSDDYVIFSNEFHLLVNETKSQRQFEIPLLRMDKQILWVQFTLSVIRDSQNNVLSVIAFVEDTSKYRKLKNILKRDEKTYRQMFEMNKIVKLLMDPEDDCHIVDANPAACQFYGYSYEEIISLKASDLSTHSIGEFREKVQQVMNKKGSSFICKHKLSSGKHREVELHFSLVTIKDRKLLYAIVNDISHKITAENELKLMFKELNDLKSAVDQHSIVAITDAKGTIKYVNEKFCEISQYSRDELLGEDHTIVNSGYHPKSFMEDLWQRIIKGEVWKGEIKNRTKDGTYYWVDTTIVPFLDSDKKPYQYVAIRTDITHKKQMTDDLQKAKESAEKANRIKSEFLANMSHEIRTPMNGIIGMTELTLGTDLSKEQKEYLEMAHSSAHSLLVLLNDILDFSKIEAGKLDFDNIRFSLRGSLTDIVKSFHFQANEKKIELTYRISPDTTDMIMGDPGRLRQVIVNLLSNALKFTESGEIILSVERADKVENKKDEEVVLHFSVRDTGMGISPDKQNLIFEAFTQVDASTTRKYGGTGLGLAISKQLVQMMEGEMWLESTLGLGSTFHFTAVFGLQSS